MEKQKLMYKNHEFGIDTYWLDPISDFTTEVKHPVAIIFPGGRFTFQTDREAQPIALKFASEGIHAIVLHYQLIEDNTPVYPLALQETATVLNWLQSQAKIHQIDLNKIILVGFSAGGHVVADFNSIMTDKTSQNKVMLDELEVLPAANILCYPVIDLTAGYPRTMEHRLAVTPDRFYWRSQEHLTVNAKPTFIWQTVDDKTVPVKNSLLYAEKMEKLNLPFELHLFASGKHGLSLGTYVTQQPGNELHLNDFVANWWELGMNWLKSINLL
ncbi:putative lipase esterase (putative) [Companilactobacillus nodensis DSM 19682 = JCM 14932 = NBRC 107160]|uniref:Putative lipase esterase (Putative) n=2 Tax=Companilactobacillus nodensis TaxID=460870 RepID=A0A0R1K7V5_9LACO|nr:alpha/beta hydrolase [Companilactobacillus nodensis]KRK79669.1 putative lipase esterase (putative) [Companilactobacillus nodensis DSM 19682 = JCM 14932 = NBRC 107160]